MIIHQSIHSKVWSLFVILFVLISQTPVIVQAQPEASIPVLNLDIPAADITRVEFGYHESSFESTTTEFKLDVQNGKLTNGKISAPLSILSPLLASFHGMLPGTRAMTWQLWTDDYPSAWVDLHLKDGRIISITSSSQYKRMFPWNISVWSNDHQAFPDAAYISLKPALIRGIEALWKGIGKSGFPRNSDQLAFDPAEEDPSRKTLTFFAGKMEHFGESSAATTSVNMANPGALDPFLPLLRQNVEIQQLLDEDFTLFDAVLDLDVTLDTMTPVQYSGMLALASPDHQDIVVGMVTIPLNSSKPVTTTLTAADVLNRTAERKADPFLSSTAQLLTPLTYLLDTRDGIQLPKFDCPANSNMTTTGSAIQALWGREDPKIVSFFPLSNQRWTVDLSLNRREANWSDDAVQSILQAWFPSTFAGLLATDLSAVSTDWAIAFLPDVTLHDPGLLDRLKAGLPSDGNPSVHPQNPEKKGDFGFLSYDGRVVLSENDAPAIIHCGKSLPNWYGKPYAIEDVTPPQENALRQDIIVGGGINGGWSILEGIFPTGKERVNWTSIAFSQPGFLHVLWSIENDGVYYADGWADGTGWIQPQRLGEDAYWLQAMAWPDGEVHLFWDASLNPGGTVHIWKPAEGTWQKPEHWPKVGYFSQILRTPDGVLHLAGTVSDGLDSEVMHWTWTPQNGLSDPENLSRMLGDTGNTPIILRVDTKGQLHAAWSHILEQKSLLDPITGETSDLSGVFYARQLPDGHWTLPEQVGVLAPYAHALSFELDPQNQPLTVWQSDGGLISRIKTGDNWQPAIELAKVKPPQTPAEFGPDRQVKPSAEVKTGVTSQGQIVVAWLIPQTELKLAFWSGNGWAEPKDILSSADASQLQASPATLELAIDARDRVHFVFFEGSSLRYAVYDHEKISLQALPILNFIGFGLPEASLQLDSAGSLLAILGLPRSPQLTAKLPPSGIPPTSTPTRAPTATPQPAPTLTPSPTPLQTTTSGDGHPPVASGLVVGGMGLGLIVLVGLIAVYRAKK